MYYNNSCYNCYFNFNHRHFFRNIFRIKKKQNGGSIIVKYSFKKREYHKLFNKEDLNLDEDDYEVIKLLKNVFY